MKASFFHDVRIINVNDEEMYSIDFGYEVWKRYLNVFDKITVCTRQENKENINLKKYKKSSGDNVEFKLNKDYKSPLQFYKQDKKVKNHVKKIVEENDACIVRLPSTMGILAAQECIKQNKPWAVEVVGCCWDSLWNYGNIQGKIAAPIMYLLTRYYTKKSSYVIYVSNEFLQKRYPNNNFTMGISDVNIESIEQNVLERRLDKIKKLDSDNVIKLGLVGSLDVDYKGHKTAIYAVKELKSKGYNVSLRCLGGGDSTRWLSLCKKLNVVNEVEFCGTLPSGNPVLEWFDDIDIFVMPSLQEGLPRSMVEAMSRGCNIVGARTGGIPELIQEEFIFSPKKYKEMASLIAILIKNKKLAIKQSKTNFEKAKKYTKEKIERDRIQFWRKFADDIKKEVYY